MSKLPDSDFGLNMTDCTCLALHNSSPFLRQWTDCINSWVVPLTTIRRGPAHCAWDRGRVLSRLGWWKSIVCHTFRGHDLGYIAANRRVLLQGKAWRGRSCVLGLHCLSYDAWCLNRYLHIKRELVVDVTDISVVKGCGCCLLAQLGIFASADVQ